MSRNLEVFPSVAISSISATSTDVRRPWEVLWASQRTAQNACNIVDNMRVAFGSEATISLVPGRNINVKKFVRHLSKDVKISSIDIPDNYPLHKMFRDMLILRKEKSGSVLNRFGWFITNVSTEKQQRRKVKKALKTTNVNTVKANTSFWREGHEKSGNKLVKVLEKYQRRTRRDISLAVEIDSEKQNPEEYLDFVRKLRSSLKGRVNVVLDVDLGHITQRGGSSESFLTTLMKDEDLKNAIHIISLNQYIPGDTEAHTRPDDPSGAVDLPASVHILGENGLEPTVLFELHPSDKHFFAEESGMSFAKKLKYAYLSGQKGRRVQE